MTKERTMVEEDGEKCRKLKKQFWVHFGRLQIVQTLL